MSMQDDIKDLVEKITSIDNEIKLLQEDRKTALEERHRQVQPRLSTKRGKNRIGLLAFNDLGQHLGR